ncbi:MAG: MOSC domain-containing protein [Rhodospirillales bacterium]|nr:MOSC domain-containing protein [Rhodospirillales bacterium]
MTITVARICRYPVKGLTPEPLDAVELATGKGLPDDRRFAIALGSTPVDGATVKWMPKSSFLTLVKYEKLAALRSRFDGATGALVIERGGRPVARGVITGRLGRAVIEEFFDAYMGAEGRGRLKLVEAAAGEVLSDCRAPMVSIINLSSVHDLERVTAAPVDPLRFRGNLFIEGADAWSEFGWIGREISVGGARLKIEVRIGRCAATNVDPEKAVRDLNIPASLQRGFRHADMGVYATVVGGGRVAAGDAVTLAD